MIRKMLREQHRKSMEIAKEEPLMYNLVNLAQMLPLAAYMVLLVWTFRISGPLCLVAVFLMFPFAESYRRFLAKRFGGER